MQSSPVFEVTVDGTAIVGPVTVEQLRHGLAAGRLPQNAWVRTPGTAQWIPVANVIGYPGSPPPDPQLAQAQRELHETQARLSALRRELESVEEAIEIQSFGVYRPKYGFQTSDEYA